MIFSKMPVSERAKQFAPFKTMPGLERALARKEKELLRETRVCLAEEGERELNETLLSLSPGDSAEVVFFSGGAHIAFTGRVKVVDASHRRLVFRDRSIPFAEIERIAKLPV